MAYDYIIVRAGSARNTNAATIMIAEKAGRQILRRAPVAATANGRSQLRR